MRGRFVALIGRPRGLTAAALIGRQLGRNGRYGEVVTITKFRGEDTYRIEIRGLDEHGRAPGVRGIGPYDASDFSEIGRYRHFSKWANATG